MPSIRSPDILRHPRAPFVVSGLIFLALASVAASLWYSGYQQQLLRREMETRVVSEEIYEHLTSWLDDRQGVLTHLAENWRHGTFVDEEFPIAARQILATHPGFRALNWIDASGTIEIIVPHAGNEPALGKNIFQHPDRKVRRAIERARALARPTATPVIELLQGGRGVASYVPIRDVDGTITGFLNGVFGLDPLLQELFRSPTLRSQYHVLLDDAAGNQLLDEELPAADSLLAVVKPLRFFDRTWTLTISPRAEHLPSATGPAGLFSLLVSVLLALGVAFLSHGVLRRQAELAQREADGRRLLEWTRALHQIEDAETLCQVVLEEAGRELGAEAVVLFQGPCAPKVNSGNQAALAGSMARELDRARLFELLHTSVVDRVCSSKAVESIPLAIPGVGAATALAAPLMLIERCQGAMVAVIPSPGGRGRRAERKRGYVEAMASHVAVALVRVEHLRERRLAEKERLQLQTQVLQSQKLESLGVLAGGIAHDFNNMLVAVLGNADLALQEMGPGAPGRDFVEDILLSGKRAAELCRQMLAYSGHGQFVVEVVDLADLVDEMGSLIEVALPKGAVLERSFDRDAPPVEVDLTQIRQVAMNLITNASEALYGEYGTVRLETGVRRVGEEELKGAVLGSELPAGRYVFLAVEDTGRGMDERTQARIFDPFFSTKRTGRGLGLSAALGIVRGHQGAVLVRSEIGRGTRIEVLLPPSGKLLGAQSPDGDGAAAESLGGTILVVDDEAAVRSVASRMLQRAGLDVLLAEDGAEAIEIVRREGERIDAVLLDLTMPGLSGRETLERMVQLRPEIHVILSSGYSSGVDQDTHPRNVVAFVGKPYQTESLLGAVSRCFRGGFKPSRG